MKMPKIPSFRNFHQSTDLLRFWMVIATLSAVFNCLTSIFSKIHSFVLYIYFQFVIFDFRDFCLECLYCCVSVLDIIINVNIFTFIAAANVIYHFDQFLCVCVCISFFLRYRYNIHILILFKCVLKKDFEYFVTL